MAHIPITPTAPAIIAELRKVVGKPEPPVTRRTNVTQEQARYVLLRYSCGAPTDSS